MMMMMLWWICWVVVSKLVSTTRWKVYILRLCRKGWGLAVYFAPQCILLLSPLQCPPVLSFCLPSVYHWTFPHPDRSIAPRIELDSIFWELFTISSLCHCLLILAIIAYIYGLWYLVLKMMMMTMMVMVMVMMWQWFLWWLWCSASPLATLTCGLN